MASNIYKMTLNKINYEISMGTDVGGVPVHTDAGSFDVHAQYAYISKVLFQLRYKCLAVPALAVQIF